MNQATGQASMLPKITNLAKSCDSMNTILEDVDPKTFLTPISFMRDSTVNIVNPSSPRHEIKIARNAK